MKNKRLLLTLLASFALAGSMVGVALAGGGNGQKIGQDPLKLALTQCSNAGVGNGEEIMAGIAGWKWGGEVIVSTDCLVKKLGDDLTPAQLETLVTDYNCVALIGRYLGAFACEIDPGNSSDHNNAGGNP